MTFRLAHLSDVHLPFQLTNPWLLLNKRLIGFLSWRFKRRHIHLSQVLDALAIDLKSIKPDHTVITGDIVNISLPTEYRQAALWLKELSDTEHLSIVPGNHDAYVNVRPDRGLGLWQPYMNNEPGDTLANIMDFPYVRYRGPIAIIGLSTACPVPLFSAAGYLGDTQIQKLDHILTTLNKRDHCRIILMHHPPFASDRHRRKQLRDINPFTNVIRKHGVELILHGHLHIPSLRSIEGPDGVVAVIGVSSASASHHNHKSPSRYHVYSIAKQPSGWLITTEIRELDHTPSFHYKKAGLFDLTIPFSRDT